MTRISCAVAAAIALSPIVTQALCAQNRIEVRVPTSLRSTPVTGRMFVILARDGGREPRLKAGNWDESVPFFGVDVSALRPRTAAVIDGNALGYPVKRLADIPPGDYVVQAVLNVYTEFHRADGHVIWAHDDQWEGQQWNVSPGNLVSEPRRVHLDPRRAGTIRLELARALPPVVMPGDTKWVKHIKIQSALLTKFWGRPMYLGATVLLPKSYDENGGTRYPVIYEQGHFTLRPPFGFDPDGKPESPERRAERERITMREPGYEFAQAWMSDDFPRMIAVTFQHPTPYYDDSYAVNSVNTGPYGDAIMTELIPYLESHFRAIPESHARLLIGGSTGGWEALALQVQHPDFFGGAWVLYPDPVDFRRYQLGNIYADTNAFFYPRTDWISSEIPAERGPDGMPTVSIRDESQLEAVLGTHGRSGEQLEIWEAVFGPIGSDGYPKPLWDKLTGHIDHDVAEYMRAHGYDLRDYLERNWSTLGPKLAGKLHFVVGDMDSFYLNLAVYHMEEFLSSMRNPRAEATFDYGRPMKPHGWQPWTNADWVRMAAKVVAANAGKEPRTP